MSDVTALLSQIESGDPRAADQLLPLVYEELRKLTTAKMANEKPGHTLQATALVHEAYARLVGHGETEPKWDNRGHFFSAAAEAMRRILVEQARSKKRDRNSGDRVRVELDEVATLANSIDTAEADRILAIHEALTMFEWEWPRRAQLVKLRFFAGMTLEEAANAQGVSVPTAKKDWAMAKVWLYRKLMEPY